MKSILQSTVFALIFISFCFARTPLINNPPISSYGTQLAFDFQGDIWVLDINGNNARRLTVHEAYDRNPLWSHDGNSIAF